MSNNNTACALQCAIPPANYNPLCRKILSGSAAKLFFSCQPIAERDTDTGELPTAAEIYAILQSRINNTTEGDPSVIRELIACGAKPAPTDTTEPAKLGYKEQVTKREHLMNWLILDQNKCNYEFLRQAQLGGVSGYIIVVTEACQMLIVEDVTTITNVSMTFAQDDSTHVWSFDTPWNNIQDPVCLEYPGDPYQLIVPGNQKVIV